MRATAVITPQDIIFQNDGGTGDMGSMTIGSDGDTNDAARFGLDDRFALKFIRLHFRGAGATLADLTINLDSHLGPDFDCELHTIKTVGLDVDYVLRVPEDEIADWTFRGGDKIVLLWTNPHSAAVFWGAEVGLVNA